MVAAAERVFAERGYNAASMDEIAAECGVTKPMLYTYFGSKEGLFAACGLAAGERFRAELREVVADRSEPAADRLWRAFKTIFERVDANRQTWGRLYPPEGPAPGGPLGARAAINRAAMTELVGELLRESAADAGLGEDAQAHLHALAHAVVGATLGVASWAVAHPEEPSELHALRLMNLVWSGLGSLERGDVWLPGEWRPVGT